MQLFTIAFLMSLVQANPSIYYRFDEIVVIEENIITKSDIAKEIALTTVLPFILPSCNVSKKRSTKD